MVNLISVLHNEYQRSFDDCQIESYSVYFVQDDEENQEYYNNQQNCYYGSSGDLYSSGLTPEEISLIENGHATFEWSKTVFKDGTFTTSCGAKDWGS